MNIVIIGGVAGGMSAATRARRMNEQANIVVLERGPHISFANCGLPYYLSGAIRDAGALFLTTPERAWQRYRIDARVRHEVLRIDRQNKVVEGVDHATGQPFRLPYDKVILAPGAAPIIPRLPGTDAKNVFVLRNVEDVLQLDAFLRSEKPVRAVVVGAGFIGLEMVEALHARGLQVAVIEKAPHALPALDAEMSGWIERELEKNGVTVRVGTGLQALHTQGDRVTAVETEAGESIACDMVLLSMGVRPITKLAEDAGLALGPSGAIRVDKAMRTSDPDIYAVGDAAEVTQGVTHFGARIPLAGSANRHGRGAGEHAATGHAPPAAAVFGTAIVRIFGLDVAITGLGRKAAEAAGYDVDTAIVHPNHHASYYPGAERLHLMLVYDKTTGKVLGAQAIGPCGVDKRIDVIATLLHFGGTIHDLASLDLCYAPQFSGAKDPVHYAAFVAENQSRELSPGVDEPVPEALLLDVRSREEAKAGMLDGAVNIPLDELRDRIGELDPNKPIVTYCELGLRGYVAARILRQNGFVDVRNLKGGYVQATRAARAEEVASPSSVENEA